MKTVFVIDENDVALEIVKKALETAGYRVVTRSNPSGSVANILREKPDVVLLDVNMPMLSGDTIAKILGRVGHNLELIVLLHGNLPPDTLRLKALACGAHGYIQKTDSAVELVRRIEYWLNKHRVAAASAPLETPPGATLSASNSSPLAAAARSSSSKIRAAPLSVADSPALPSASSSAKLRAAAVVNSSTSTGAGMSPSSGAFKAATVVNSQGSSGSAKNGAGSRDLAAAKSPPGGEGDRGGGGKVLFVDDDWSMLNSYRAMVAGHLEADFVSSGEDAFQRILSGSPPRIVVCDVMMPGLSGADVYRRAVLLDARWARRFLFVTGAASTASVAEFLNSLDIRVFHKPVAPERLLETLRQMAETPTR